MAKKIPNALIGIAGVHFVAYRLSLRSLIALPTIRNAEGYNIVVTTPNGKKHANIQVKTSQKRVSFWPMPKSEKVHAGLNDYYVLLRWFESEDRFEGFMLRGREAKQAVLSEERRQLKSRVSADKVFPSVYLRLAGTEVVDSWRTRWQEWTLR